MKLIKTFFALIVVIAISGCSTGNNTNENVFEKINKKYINIPSYTASGILTVVGNKSENSYNFSQVYKSQNQFRMDFDDIIFISTDDGVFVRNNKINSNVDANNLKSEMYLYFVNSFFKQYFTCENIKLPDVSKKERVVLECDTQHKYLIKGRLYLNSKTLIPEILEFYDANGICKYKIEIKQFKFEKNIKDDLFNI